MSRYSLPKTYENMGASIIDSIVCDINNTNLTHEKIGDKYGIDSSLVAYIYRHNAEVRIAQHQKHIKPNVEISRLEYEMPNVDKLMRIRQLFNDAPITTDDQGNKVKLVRSIPEFWDIVD